MSKEITRVISEAEVIEGINEFKVDISYRGYVLLGWAQGMFRTQQGRQVPYYNMFVFSPVSTYRSDDYQAYAPAVISSGLTQPWIRKVMETAITKVTVTAKRKERTNHWLVLMYHATAIPQKAATPIHTLF